jgi:hypothetical protein
VTAKKKVPRTFGVILLFSGLLGCAHSYYYKPEISGPGAIYGEKGGIVYTIPPQGTPDVILRVRSLGIHRVHNVQMVGVRMSFGRAAGVAPSSPSAGAAPVDFINPNEQLIHLTTNPSEAGIKPAFVHSKSRKQDFVDLTGSTHEVIELLYPLPKDSEGAAYINSFSFYWKVHFSQSKTEQQSVRFDRLDSAPLQAAEVFPEDADYPYDVSPVTAPGWENIRDPYWWAVDPWWPWR